jgi:hypothetical protein
MDEGVLRLGIYLRSKRGWLLEEEEEEEEEGKVNVSHFHLSLYLGTLHVCR